MNDPVYLDYNATAKVRPEAREAVLRALDLAGNPSSIHAKGRIARAMLERARTEVAALVVATPAQVTFVSGGTEADALALDSARAAGAQHILLGATEHDAVREWAEASGLPITIWPVDGRGVANLMWLEAALRKGPPALACLMLANNETGVIQPVAQAAALVRAAGAWLHVDAVQAAGKIAIDMDGLGADTLALSAHKLGGPQGIGALVARNGVTVARRQHGGGQERGARAGTENLPGAAGFGAAARIAGQSLGDSARQAPWRDALARIVEQAGGTVMGADAPRLPQTLCFAMPDFPSEMQVMALDLAGVMVSAGAACASGKVRASRIAEAMGRPDLAPFTLRISGGWASTESDWRRCGEAWLAALKLARPSLEPA